MMDITPTIIEASHYDYIERLIAAGRLHPSEDIKQMLIDLEIDFAEADEAA